MGRQPLIAAPSINLVRDSSLDFNLHFPVGGAMRFLSCDAMKAWQTGELPRHLQLLNVD